MQQQRRCALSQDPWSSKAVYKDWIVEQGNELDQNYGWFLYVNHSISIDYAAYYLPDLVLAKLFIVPFSQDDQFIGREEILDELDLGGKQAVAEKHKRDALVGLGGVG